MGGSDPNPLVYVCLPSFFCQNHPEVRKHVLFKKKIFRKKTVFLTWAFPYWGGGGGVCPYGNFSYVTPFFSEDVPYYDQILYPFIFFHSLSHLFVAFFVLFFFSFSPYFLLFLFQVTKTLWQEGMISPMFLYYWKMFFKFSFHDWVLCLKIILFIFMCLYNSKCAGQRY